MAQILIGIVKGSPKLALAEAPTIGVVAGDATITVVFSRDVAAGDMLTGASLTKNGAAEAIVSATLQADNRTVYYVVAVAANSADEYVWRYDQRLGSIQSVDGHKLHSTGHAVENYVSLTFFVVGSGVVGYSQIGVGYGMLLPGMEGYWLWGDDSRIKFEE